MVSVQLPQKINKMSGVSLPPMQGGFTQSQIILAMQCKDAWKECWDPKTEQMFYFNKIIATRQLEKPAVLCERERQEREDKSSNEQPVVKTEKEILAEAEIMFRKKRYRLLRALHKNKYNAINTSNSASRRSSGNINDNTNSDSSTVQSSLLYNGITVTSNNSNDSNTNSTLLTSQSTSVLSPNNTNKLKETLKLELRREYMLGDCFKVLHGLKLIDFYRRLKVEFVGEAGIDSGGLSKEAFLLLSKQAASYIGPAGRHWMHFIEGKIDTNSTGNGDVQQGLFFVSNSQINAHNAKYNELCVARQKAGRTVINTTNTTNTTNANNANKTNSVTSTISANNKANNTTAKTTTITKSTIPVEMCCDLDSIMTLNSETFFRFLGKLFGKALFDRQLIDFPFSSLLLQHMLGGMSFERNMNANGTIKSPSQSPVKPNTSHNVNSNSGGNSSSTTATNSTHNRVSNINIGSNSNCNSNGGSGSSDADKQTSEVLSMLEEIKDIDTALYTQLKWIASNNITDVIYETFSITETTGNNGSSGSSNNIVLPLCANGENRHVTEENKLEYIQLVLLYKTKYSVSSSLFPFLESFHEFIPLSILQQVEISKNELNLILNGKSTVDVEELRAYCLYQSDDEAEFNETHDSIIFLWRLFREMSDEDRRILLKFFTGSSRVPLDGYDPPLSVTQGTDMRDDSLPRAHTCFNQLVLPNYTSYDICKEKIMFAMRNTEGFELS